SPRRAGQSLFLRGSMGWLNYHLRLDSLTGYAHRSIDRRPRVGRRGTASVYQFEAFRQKPLSERGDNGIFGRDTLERADRGARRRGDESRLPEPARPAERRSAVAANSAK